MYGLQLMKAKPGVQQGLAERSAAGTWEGVEKLVSEGQVTHQHYKSTWVYKDTSGASFITGV